MKTKLCIAVLTIGLSMASCSKDEANRFDSQDAGINAKMDEITDDIGTIVENQYRIQLAASGRSAAAVVQNILPDCATVTTTFTDTNWTAIISFSAGCTLANGNSVEGIITVTGGNDFNSSSYYVYYSMIDFLHNGRSIDGSRQVIFNTMPTEAQPEPHPVADIEIDFIVTYPNGTQYTRTGHRVRDLIQGYDTAVWSDNVYLISGSWTTGSSSIMQTSTVAVPLRLEMTCPHIVSGTVNITREGNSAVLDYGNGDCDDDATLSINGGTATAITL